MSVSFNEVGHAGDSHCLRSVLDVPYVCVGKHMKTEDIGSPEWVCWLFLTNSSLEEAILIQRLPLLMHGTRPILLVHLRICPNTDIWLGILVNGKRKPNPNKSQITITISEAMSIILSLQFTPYEFLVSPIAVAFHFLLYLARITTTTLRRLVLFAFSLLSFVGVNEAWRCILF